MNVGEITTNPIRTFDVVFDIDNVLTDTSVGELDEIKFYQQKGFVLTAMATHYIFPGVIEMMQRLFSMPDVRVSFYSAGSQNRNEAFVERLLERALGKEHYLKIKDGVQILSGIKDDGGTDLIVNTKEKCDIQRQKYDLYIHDQTKSLEKVVGQGKNLENSVLIDDDESRITFGQEANYLFAPCLCTEDLKMKGTSYISDEQGQTINLECNRICYVAGVLFKALEYARAGSPLTNFLFPLHFSPDGDTGNFKPLFCTENPCHDRGEYYYYGFEELKKANPRFTLINPQIYQEYCEMKTSQEEMVALQRLFKNQKIWE